MARKVGTTKKLPKLQLVRSVTNFEPIRLRRFGNSYLNGEKVVIYGRLKDILLLK